MQIRCPAVRERAGKGTSLARRLVPTTGRQCLPRAVVPEANRLSGACGAAIRIPLYARPTAPRSCRGDWQAVAKTMDDAGPNEASRKRRRDGLREALAESGDRLQRGPGVPGSQEAILQDRFSGPATQARDSAAGTGPLPQSDGASTGCRNCGSDEWNRSGESTGTGSPTELKVYLLRPSSSA